MNGITNEIRIGEETPLEPGQNNKVFVNTVFLNTKANVQAPLGKSSAMDVEINTKIPVEIHSKKLKCGLIVVITVSTLSAILSISLAYYHCVNMSLLQKQVDFLLLKMENISSRQDSGPQSLASSSAEAQMASPHVIFNSRELPNVIFNEQAAVHTSPSPIKPAYNMTTQSNDLSVSHFNGAHMELNMGTDSIIGPWARDNNVSSPNSHEKIELENKQFVVKDGGLYIIYVQVVYLTQEPCCYFVWARLPAAPPRLLAACSAGGDVSGRPLSRAQLSCATHTVARLHTGDVINLAQREHNRTLWLRPGYSYIGFIKIGS